MDVNGDEPKGRNYKAETSREGAGVGIDINSDCDLQRVKGFPIPSTLSKVGAKAPSHNLDDSSPFDKNKKKRTAESQDYIQGQEDESFSAKRSSTSLSRGDRGVAAELAAPKSSGADCDASTDLAPSDGQSDAQLVATFSGAIPPTALASNPETESSAKVFGAGSLFGGFNPGISSRTFGSSVNSSPSPVSGFACLMSSNSDGMASSTGFRATVPSVTGKTAPNVSAFSGSYTFGLFPKSPALPPPSTSSSAGGVSSNAVVNLPENVELTTGEEDETNLFAVRCKSYKWVIEEQTTGEDLKALELQQNNFEMLPSAKSPKSSDEDAKPLQVSPRDYDKQNNATHPSVPPSANFNEGAKRNQEDSPFLSGSFNRRWQELGIGPLKVLQKAELSLAYKPGRVVSTSVDNDSVKNVDWGSDQSAACPSTRVRLVQRRESAPNGPATKVILNVPLWKESTVAKSSERHVSLTTLNENGQGETFLFKFKTGGEANLFSAKLADFIAITKSCVKESNRT